MSTTIKQCERPPSKGIPLWLITQTATDIEDLGRAWRKLERDSQRDLSAIQRAQEKVDQDMTYAAAFIGKELKTK